MKTLITRNTWNAITNLMDDEKRERVAYDPSHETEDDFLEEYLNLDPEFEDVLKSEFNINISDVYYDGIIVED